ncbi:DEAD/DEAH box helicase [Microbacterium sp. P04]|uniref:DEAD/DEAH box helicase n=1 Tax=Microbacterium sp. P04 TaxID=3366947 RepID=UPI0037463417
MNLSSEPDDAPPAWRALLPSEDSAEQTPLALGIELRQREAHDPRRWDPRKVEAVTPRMLAAGQHDLQLAVRPLMRGARGEWIKGDVSWDAVRRSPGRFGVHHTRWFAELFAIVRPSATVGVFSSVSEWITLDAASASSHLWAHLRAADRLGIPLVAPHPQQSVAVAAQADVGIVVAPASHDALRVAARVRVDGVDIDPAHVRPLGRSGLFAFTVDGDPVRMTIAAATLDDAVVTLLETPDGIVVPPSDVAAFLREAYPRLARRANVTTLGGLRPPTALHPTLRLTVAFRGDAVTVAQAWSYPGLAPFADDTRHPDRDASAEGRLSARVSDTWAEASDLPYAVSGVFRDADAAEFSAKVLPALQLIPDVRVEITGDRPAYRELTGAPDVTVTAVETHDPDWFDLGVIVSIDGRTIPLGPLLRALTRGARRMKLSDGAYFALGHPSLVRLKELLDEAAGLDEWTTDARIGRYQSALWADFEDLADQAHPARAWRETVAGLSGAVEGGPLPAGLRADLRPYQRSGFDWLTFHWRNRLGGILADDMGLGKTLQVLTLVAHAREEGEQRPFLVVAPTSVLPTWADEAARFTPGLVVRTLGATSATSGTNVTDAAAVADLVVTSYAVLRLDEAAFVAGEWAGVILDEAQFVKNPRTKLHRAVKSLRSEVTFALTGTPLENGLADLWALFSLTAPGLFPSARRFRDEYVGPIEKGRVPENQEGGPYRAARLARLRHRIRPFLLRRTKELVASELPPKQEQDIHIELSPDHRALYDTVLQRERQKVLGLIDDLDRNRLIVFRSLTLLRLLSLAPELVDSRHASLGSSKLDALLARLSEVIAEGHRALVFSQFTSFLALAAARLDAAGIAYASLDGSTTRRGEVIEGFRSGDAPVFLVSLKAGGFGLTLTEADYVFVLDPWWNPAAESQAIDRAHRIGQDKPVFVYRLLAAGTIEQKVRALQERKARLFDSVVDDGDLFAQTLTADDIRGILEI